MIIGIVIYVIAMVLIAAFVQGATDGGDGDWDDR